MFYIYYKRFLCTLLYVASFAPGATICMCVCGSRVLCEEKDDSPVSRIAWWRIWKIFWMNQSDWIALFRQAICPNSEQFTSKGVFYTQQQFFLNRLKRAKILKLSCYIKSNMAESAVACNFHIHIRIPRCPRHRKNIRTTSNLSGGLFKKSINFLLPLKLFLLFFVAVFLHYIFIRTYHCTSLP